MSMADVTAAGWELLGRRDPPGQRPSLHTQIEAAVFKQVSAVFPDVMVSVRDGNHRNGIVITGRIQRFNKVLDYNVATRLDIMGVADIANYTSTEIWRALAAALVYEVTR